MLTITRPVPYDDSIPEGLRAVQQALDSFADINYTTIMYTAIELDFTEEGVAHYSMAKILDVICNNPFLESIPRYFRDGRQDYLWYSDFYDEISKEDSRKYRAFSKQDIKITHTNYATELAKVNLPYFAELVHLITMERLYLRYKKYISEYEEPLLPKVLAKEEDIINEEPAVKTVKRSYQPKMSREQYKLLAASVEAIRLFRRPINVSQLKRLLTGKLDEPLQVANQKSLVYLFDQLMEAGYIKDTWIAVADGNADFISFRTEKNKQRYGSKPHPINMQQLINCRNRNKREAITGMDDIDDLIEQMEANPYK